MYSPCFYRHVSLLIFEADPGGAQQSLAPIVFATLIIVADLVPNMNISILRRALQSYHVSTQNPPSCFMTLQGLRIYSARSRKLQVLLFRCCDVCATKDLCLDLLTYVYTLHCRSAELS